MAISYCLAKIACERGGGGGNVEWIRQIILGLGKVIEVSSGIRLAQASSTLVKQIGLPNQYIFNI